MKYEVFLVRYASVIVEAENEEEAEEIATEMCIDVRGELDDKLATESEWEIDNVPIEEIKNV